MKKAITIVSAIIAIIFAIHLISILLSERIDTSLTIVITFMLLIIFISLLVMLNIKLPKFSTIILMIVSMLIIIIELFYILEFIVHLKNVAPGCRIIIYTLAQIPILITLFTYILRALKLTEIKDNK